jgi:transmembrane sensor
VQSAQVLLFDTAAAEKHRFTLRDGTQITLGNQTHLSVHYDHCQRTVLFESGEAFFNVVHNPECPFVVIAGHGQVTAIGTQFTVNRTLDRVTVNVAEGAVDVRPREESTSVQDIREPPVVATSKWTRTTLRQGQGVSFDGTRHRGPVESEDPKVATAWIEGHREYRHDPLSYVVADINRYFNKQIVLEDGTAAQLQFTGRIYETQVMDWLNALERIFPVTVSEVDKDHISIRSRRD